MEQIVRTPDQLGAALRRERRHAAVTQTILAEMTGLRQATVSSVEAGHAATHFTTVCQLMAALDLELVLRPRSPAGPDLLGDAP